MARSKAARANISISSSTVMSPEFLLFKKFQQGLVQQFEKAPSSQLMCILADLLKVVLDRNLYKPMNDSVSRDMMIYLKAQYSWILTTCTVIIDSGSSAGKSGV